MRYIGWFVHLLTRCLLGGSACWVVHHCTVCGCLMVLKLFSIQDKMGRILWRTWPLWRCWWYWLWWWVSTPTRGGTTISTLRRVSIAGTPMLLDKLTLLPNKDNQPGDRGHSPWGHGPLVGGTMMVSQLFLFILFLLSYSTLFHPTPLHSTPLPTPNLLISPDFVNHYCALCPLALPCLDTWPHSISNIWHILIVLKCVPQPHTLGYCTACSFICTCMHIAMILQFFPLFFPISLFCSILLLLLHSAPPQPTIHWFFLISLITITHHASQLCCADRHDLIAYMKHIWCMTCTATIETHPTSLYAAIPHCLWFHMYCI